jgi:hypothetical protein
MKPVSRGGTRPLQIKPFALADHGTLSRSLESLSITFDSFKASGKYGADRSSLSVRNRLIFAQKRRV